MKGKNLNKYGYPKDISIDWTIDRGMVEEGASMELVDVFDIMQEDTGYTFVDGDLSITITRSVIEKLLELAPRSF